MMVFIVIVVVLVILVQAIAAGLYVAAHLFWTALLVAAIVFMIMIFRSDSEEDE